MVPPLLGCKETLGERVITELVDAQLLDFTGLDGIRQARYRFHDLVRTFGRTELGDRQSSGFTMAFSKLAQAYGTWLEYAEVRAKPGDLHRFTHSSTIGTDINVQVRDAIDCDPITWFNSQRSTAVQLVRQAATLRLDEPVWAIAKHIGVSAENRLYWPDWLDVLEKAINSCHVLGEAQLAKAQFLMGDALIIQERDRDAMPLLTRSLSLFESCGDTRSSALAKLVMAYALILQSNVNDAEIYLLESLATFRDISDTQSIAEALCDLAIVRKRQERIEEACNHYNEAAQIFRRLDNHRWVAFVIVNLGELQAASGHTDEAFGCFSEVLPILETYDRLWSADKLTTIGRFFNENGHTYLARRAWDHASTVYRLHEKAEPEQLTAMLEPPFRRRFWRIKRQ